MKRKKKRWLGRLGILIFAVYTATTLISLQAQINRKKAENAALEEQLEEQNLLNTTLREDTGSDDKDAIYARIAREKLGLVMPGEVIIVNQTP